MVQPAASTSRTKTVEVVLDTNFLLIPVRRKRDILTELKEQGYKLTILQPVWNELIMLSQGSSVVSREAKTTLSLLERKGLKSTPSSEPYADTAIIAYCVGSGAAAATHDNELRRSLREKGIAVVTLGRSGTLHTEALDVLQAQGSRPHPRTPRSVR